MENSQEDIKTLVENLAALQVNSPTNMEKQIFIQWNDTRICFVITPEETLVNVKNRIMEMTGIRADLMELTNLKIPGNINDDKVMMKDLELPPYFTLRVVDKTSTQYLIRLNVEYKNKRFQLVCFGDSTIEQLKFKIKRVINLDVYQQDLTNLCYPGNTKLGMLNMEPDFLLRVQDKHEFLENVHKPGPSSFGTFNQEQMMKNHSPETNQHTIHFKKFRRPRCGKNVLVLSVDDKMLFKRGKAKIVPRPFLQFLLHNVYPMYEIGIFSLPTKSVLEKTLQSLNMINNPDYKILFHINMTMTTFALTKAGNSIVAKPLDAVWSQYPRFNRNNTILCDISEDSFTEDKRNCIKLQPFNYENPNSDAELMKLANYLLYICKYSDFSEIDHQNWNETSRPMSDDYKLKKITKIKATKKDNK